MQLLNTLPISEINKQPGKFLVRLMDVLDIDPNQSWHKWHSVPAFEQHVAPTCGAGTVEELVHNLQKSHLQRVVVTKAEFARHGSSISHEDVMVVSVD